ncbi:MAG: 3'(2'),5'-bisphosphate nucleotidase CysQ, partial [Alphaproteobacteria bacterium]
MTARIAPAQAPSLADDHALLVDAVRAAGRIAARYFRKPQKTWEKQPDHIVSEADIEVDRALHRELTAARPDYGWLSEESEDDLARLGRSRLWVIDPIDGTHSFLKGRPEFTVAGALAVAGEPVVGAIFNPITGEMFEAIKGGGARLNGTRIRVSATRALCDARLIASRTESAQSTLTERLGVREVMPISSIAYKLALVAA